MPRRKITKKRESIPDPRYGSVLVSQLVNRVMMCGKKSLAYSIVYASFHVMSEKLGKADVVDLFLGALVNIRPKVEVKSRRVGGTNYQVPVEIPRSRQDNLAIKWLVSSARARKGIAMSEALGLELVDAWNDTGSVVRKREETHKMAQANRAFAHFAHARS